MRKLLSTIVILTTVFYTSTLSAKNLPGITDRDTGYLECAARCIRTFNSCTDKLPPIGKAGDFSKYSLLKKRPLQTLLSCHRKQEACYAQCGRDFPN